MKESSLVKDLSKLIASRLSICCPPNTPIYSYHSLQVAWMRSYFAKYLMVTSTSNLSIFVPNSVQFHYLTVFNKIALYLFPEKLSSHH